MAPCACSPALRPIGRLHRASAVPFVSASASRLRRAPRSQPDTSTDPLSEETLLVRVQHAEEEAARLRQELEIAKVGGHRNMRCGGGGEAVAGAAVWGATILFSCHGLAASLPAAAAAAALYTLCWHPRTRRAWARLPHRRPRPSGASTAATCGARRCLSCRNSRNRTAEIGCASRMWSSSPQKCHRGPARTVGLPCRRRSRRSSRWVGAAGWLCAAQPPQPRVDTWDRDVGHQAPPAGCCMPALPLPARVPQRRLVIGIGAAAGLGAFALIPTEYLSLTKPSKPLFFYLSPLVRVEALLAEAAAAIEAGNKGDLQVILRQIERLPNNLQDNLRSAAACESVGQLLPCLEGCYHASMPSHSLPLLSFFPHILLLVTHCPCLTPLPCARTGTCSPAQQPADRGGAGSGPGGLRGSGGYGPSAVLRRPGSRRQDAAGAGTVQPAGGTGGSGQAQGVSCFDAPGSTRRSSRAQCLGPITGQAHGVRDAGAQGRGGYSSSPGPGRGLARDGWLPSACSFPRRATGPILVWSDFNFMQV